MAVQAGHLEISNGLFPISVAFTALVLRLLSWASASKGGLDTGTVD